MTPQVENLTLTNANTEYEWLVPANTGYFSIQARTLADVRYAHVTGKVAGSTAPYGTLKAGQVWNSPERILIPANTTIYFASPVAGTILEITSFQQIA